MCTLYRYLLAATKGGILNSRTSDDHKAIQEAVESLTTESHDSNATVTTRQVRLNLYKLLGIELAFMK